MSTDPAAIALPATLRPGDGRFGSGPSKVPADAVAELAAAAPRYLGTSHRKPGVKHVVRAVREGLADLFGLPAGYEVLLGNGGSTLFWDAAAFGLVESRAQHLVFGEFGAKFAAVTAAAPHLDDPEVIESEAGTHPDLHATPGVDAYAYPHNETSTGVMTDVVRLGGIEPGALMVVDATSGAGGLRVDPRAFDVYYFAPQKCFASDGGLWLALCSPAAIERIERLHASDRWTPPTLDLHLALTNSRQDQTYNTPALATLFLLERQIAWMRELGGLEACASRCDRSADVLYGWAEQSRFATPFVAKPDERSHVTGTIDLDASIRAEDVCTALRANGIVDTESYRKLDRNQLRIAMFPAIEPDDVRILTDAVDAVVAELAA